MDDLSLCNSLEKAFLNITNLYIADGHHRAASAVKVGLKRREENSSFTGNEEFNFFLSVLFADDELKIYDYNRVVEDLNGLSKENFLKKINGNFHVEKSIGNKQVRPQERQTFGMYLENEWYQLKAKRGTFDENDPVKSLDVSILQNNLLKPILGINNPKTDKRIDFIGGIRGLDELEKRASTDMKIAFAMHPPSIIDLINVSDAGMTMPPKSTWFEPKLRSGLFIHKLSD